jgi:RimJ/RimL family protein N-acetyltransferase
MFGPVLEGTKVTLRPADDSDPARFVAWFADLEVTRYLGRLMAVALYEEEDYLKRTGESKNDVFWMIDAEGRTIGATGIHRIDWPNARATTGTVIGDKTAWRRGFGSEAMAMRTEYAFRQLNLHKLSSGAFLDNEPSKRALIKAGYREIGVERDHFFRSGRWHDHWMAEVLRPDWERARG